MAGFLKRFFTRASSQQDASSEAGVEQEPVADEPGMIDIDDPRFEQYFKAREAYWSKIGDVDEDVIAYMISPEFLEAPAWPTTRQAFRVIRRQETVIIASDGLTDLFVDTSMKEPGFGTEVYIETDALVGMKFDALRDSWAFELIETFARNVANWGGIAHHLEQESMISVELPAPESMPTEWVTPSGTVGVLANMVGRDQLDRVQLDSDNHADMVPITLIYPSELSAVIAGGKDARYELSRHLQTAGFDQGSRMGRPSFM